MTKTMEELDITRRGIASRVGVMEKEMRTLNSRMRDLEVRLEHASSEIEDLEKDYAIVDDGEQEDETLDRNRVQEIAEEIGRLSDELWWRSKESGVSQEARGHYLKLSEALKDCGADLESLVDVS